MTEALLVVTTTQTRDLAERIAYELVERRQAGCVQITGPAESTYRWQGQMEISREEWVLSAKTTPERYAAVEASIRELHTFKTPEIIATPIVAGAAAYLSWLRESVTESPPTESATAEVEAGGLRPEA
jgi:periplasmic divalent cation tolerance protein